MGILYTVNDPMILLYWLVMLVLLMALNELSRASLWTGIGFFIVLPIILTIWVFPVMSPMGNEYGTGNWFTWVKTYSALAGCIGFLALRYLHWEGKDGKTHYLYEKRWALAFPPFILALNIAEACIRDFQVFSFMAWNGDIFDSMWLMSGPWNIMNGIAGILNIITLCGWCGIFISKDKTRDMIWPDMLWFWIIAYDLWNFAYTYNCMTDHSAWTGALLLIGCTIPTFWIKKGAWLQHRAHTLALYCMFGMSVPMWSDVLAPIYVTRNPTAFFVVSLIALLFNVGVFVYQIKTIRAKKLNPLKDELYTDSKKYLEVVAENK